jgi:signal transduction histidine kinase
LVQEALYNVYRHANATQAVVRLCASYPTIILRIEDDGTGFDVKTKMAMAIENRRMGLLSMSERTRLLHGTMRIQSDIGGGTRIFIEIPYRENSNGAKKDCPDRR